MEPKQEEKSLKVLQLWCNTTRTPLGIWCTSRTHRKKGTKLCVSSIGASNTICLFVLRYGGSVVLVWKSFLQASEEKNKTGRKTVVVYLLPVLKSIIIIIPHPSEKGAIKRKGVVTQGQTCPPSETETRVTKRHFEILIFILISYFRPMKECGAKQTTPQSLHTHHHHPSAFVRRTLF